MPPGDAMPIADIAPTNAHIVDYDRAQGIVYLRLLDAEKEGATWEEAAKIILAIDPTREPERAKRAYDTHLARAKWMTKSGYKDLLRGPA